MTTCRVSLQTFPLNSCPASHLSRYSSFTFYLLLAFLFYLLPPYPSPLPFYFCLFLVFPFTIYICPTKHQKKTKYDEVKCNLFRSTITNLKSSLIWKKYSKYSTIGRASFFKSQKLTLRDLSQWAVARLSTTQHSSKPQQISIVSRSADQLKNLSADDQLSTDAKSAELMSSAEQVLSTKHSADSCD